MKLHILPARQGTIWARMGVRIFMRQPLAMTGLFFLFIALVALLSMVPYLGAVLGLMVIPAATLGFMYATHEALRGRLPMTTLLTRALSACSQSRKPLFTLGLWYAMSFLGIMGLTTVVDGGAFANFYLTGNTFDSEVLKSAPFQTAMYSALLLYLPVSLAFWHAPALVHWHQVPPLKSLFFSLVACLRNFSAFTVFGLIWFGLMLGCGLLLSVIGSLAGVQLASVMVMPAILWVASMFFCSQFFTFHDCFITQNGDANAQEIST